jgi:hypothetical protein
MYISRLVFFFLLLDTQPLLSQNNNLNMSASTSFISKNSLGFNTNGQAKNKNNINFNLEYSKKKFIIKIVTQF